jgi:hypothetical protein
MGLSNPEDMAALFKGLPAIDSSIEYPKQANLLQIGNIALLDEIKRLEVENREIKKNLDKRGDMQS